MFCIKDSEKKRQSAIGVDIGIGVSKSVGVHVDRRF